MGGGGGTGAGSGTGAGGASGAGGGGGGDESVQHGGPTTCACAERGVMSPVAPAMNIPIASVPSTPKRPNMIG